MSFLDDSDENSDEEVTRSEVGSKGKEGITSLTPFLERKGLDFSDPNTVTLKNFDIL